MERCMESPITTCISTNNNLDYVKLAYESVRKNENITKTNRL